MNREGLGRTNCSLSGHVFYCIIVVLTGVSPEGEEGSEGGPLPHHNSTGGDDRNGSELYYGVI